MQNKKALVVSLVIAVFALLLVYSYIAKKEAQLFKAATPINVIVAVKDIPAGTRLTDSMIEVRQIPKKYVQPGAKTSIEEVRDRIIGLPALEGSQILESMFVTMKDMRIAKKIPANKRAFSIAVTDVTSVAGLIEPGDYVDVMLAVETGSHSQGRAVAEGFVTKTLLQNILVLSVNKRMRAKSDMEQIQIKQKAAGSLYDRPGQEKRTEEENIEIVTLSLTPREVLQMNLAHEIGSVTLALRSSRDDGTFEEMPTITAKELLGIDKTVLPKGKSAWMEIRGSEQVLY